MQRDYLKTRLLLGGKTISEGFFQLFSASLQLSQISQATRNRAVSPMSDARAAGEGRKIIRDELLRETPGGFGRVLS